MDFSNIYIELVAMRSIRVIVNNYYVELQPLIAALQRIAAIIVTWNAWLDTRNHQVVLCPSKLKNAPQQS